MTARRGRWFAEFVLIVVGVLAALAVDDWRERRSERASEEHLLAGIRTDLERDLEDLGSGISGAHTRMAGADELLAMVGDPDAGAVRIAPVEGADVQQLLSRTYEAYLTEARRRYPPGSWTAQQALLMTSTMLRFDIADGTYSEATASGRLEVIQDLDVRAAITQYYFDARRFGPTVDDRVEATVERYTAVLAEAGLSPAERASDEKIVSTIRDAPQVIAELKNVRYWAAFQADRHDLIASLASALATQIDAALR